MSKVEEEALILLESQLDGTLSEDVNADRYSQEFDSEDVETMKDHTYDEELAKVTDLCDSKDDRIKALERELGLPDWFGRNETSLFDLVKMMESRLEDLEQVTKSNPKSSTTANPSIYKDDFQHGDEKNTHDKNFGDNDDYEEYGVDKGEKEKERFKYPETCFSFVALNGPKKDGSWPTERKLNFLFGLVPFFFQMSLLLLLAVSKTNEIYGTIGETDNPDAGKGHFMALLASFTPANATPIIRVAQMLSIAAYVFFPGDSLQDVLRGVQLFPLPSKKNITEPVACMRFACLLQLMAGLTAMIVTIFLVLTSNTVVDIILNFTAVNFISDLDEAAFSLAKEGELLEAFEREAKRISKKDLPDCFFKYNSSKKSCKLYVSCFLYLIAFGMMAFVFASQDSTKVWVTGTLRVQFQEETGLDSYSGCFEMNTDPSSIQFSRRTYHSVEGVASNASFGYCRKERQWILYRGDASNPCDAAIDNSEFLLARSSKTDNFDISTSFDESWFSASNTPLDMYFFDGEDEQEIEDHCDSFLGDGKCDPFFNKPGYQYDGGDCCAATCTKPACGRGGLTSVFGDRNISGDGFATCNDPSMFPITIHLNDIVSNRDPKFTGLDWENNEPGILSWSEFFSFETLDEVQTWEAVPPLNPYFSLDCDGKNVMTAYIEESMVNKSQTVMVEDGVKCILVIRNTTTDIDILEDDPIWFIDYSVFQGANLDGNTVMEILTSSSAEVDTVVFSRIPTCYVSKLQGHTDSDIFYSASQKSSSNIAIDWLMDDGTGNSECEDPNFIQRYALVKSYYAMRNQTSNTTDFLSRDRQCTWPSVTCRGGSVVNIDLINADLRGNISSALSLLPDLEGVQVSSDQILSLPQSGLGQSIKILEIQGSYLPTEIQMVENLEKLILSGNTLDSLPSEIGHLSNLLYFDLTSNALSSLPSEFGNISNLHKLNLGGNDFESIPSQIFNLSSLKSLFLDSNRVSYLPAEIGNITGLQELDFGSNDLQQMSPEIGNLTSMKYLHFDWNEISFVPTEIGNLTSLQRLDFYFNIITDMPSVIGNLESLEYLDFAGNALSSVPSELGNLSRLENLFLEYNELTSIPSELGNLSSLQSLLLYYNLLTSLPSEIGNLSSLQLLDLDGNDISSVPSEIGNLSTLETLWLNDNDLVSLPSEIGNLSALQTLYLHDNELISLPSEIGNLSALQTLYLQNNLLTSLPTEIGNLSNLVTLSLENNNLLSLPPEMEKLTNLETFSFSFRNATCDDIIDDYAELCYVIDCVARDENGDRCYFEGESATSTSSPYWWWYESATTTSPFASMFEDENATISPLWSIFEDENATASPSLAG
eukprot:CAMPEP_0116121006 /NCGR_PEP_ID=MMETSP0329-20121206/3473_1 /TAXON_ID=697910 /ORGANISM="Pseudo-nitzschia arenysensis, Strain B593" /LENGTH=1333 /DNA_ID=CAMNT_0003614803 /DNA_START=191 /DNA_END=4192 /DNA_ORIENTATION=+